MKKFKVTMEITVSGRLVPEDTDSNEVFNFVENMITENLRSASNEDFTVEAKDIWAKEIHEEKQ